MRLIFQIFLAKGFINILEKKNYGHKLFCSITYYILPIIYTCKINGQNDNYPLVVVFIASMLGEFLVTQNKVFLAVKSSHITNSGQWDLNRNATWQVLKNFLKIQLVPLFFSLFQFPLSCSLEDRYHHLGP